MTKTEQTKYLATFPKESQFVDFSGQKRMFSIDFVNKRGTGFTCRAFENVADPDGYEFSGYSPVNPIDAFTELTGQICKALATRYLDPTTSCLSLLTDTAAGRVSNGGVVIDGKFVDWDSFLEVLQSHEGWNFRVTFSDKAL